MTTKPDELFVAVVSAPGLAPKATTLQKLWHFRHWLTSRRALTKLAGMMSLLVLAAVIAAIAWRPTSRSPNPSPGMCAGGQHQTCSMAGSGGTSQSSSSSSTGTNKNQSVGRSQTQGGSNGNQQSGSPSPPPTRQLVYGLDFLPSGMNSAPAYALMQQAHARVMRVGASWSQVQPTSTRQYNWAPVDRQTQLGSQYGVKLILQLGDTPAWDLPSSANGNTRAVPADCQNGGTCQAVYTYVTDLVAHLGASSPVAFIIPRNEVYDTAKNWIGGMADDYARYLNAVYRAVQDAHSSIKVMPGGDELIPSAYTASPMYKPGSAGAQFAQALFANPLFCKSMDIDDVHLGYSGPSWGPQVVDTTEQGLQACAGKAIPIWITETALTSDPTIQTDAAHTAVLGSAYTHGSSSQAQYLTDTYTALAKDTTVYGINWTFLIDNPASTDTPNSRYGGLADTSYSAKPALDALELIAQ